MEFISHIAKYGIMIELLLIAIIIVSTYLYKIVHYYREKYKKLLITDLQLFFLKKMRLGEIITDESLLNKYKKIEYLLPMVKQLDKNRLTKGWLDIRIDFICSILLPLARKAALSNDWVKRYSAAEVFALHCEHHDNLYIFNLLTDSIPWVSYVSASAAIIFGSEQSISLVVAQMSKNSWLTQTLYIQAFNRAPSATCYAITKGMKKTENPIIRAACYNVLLKYPLFSIDCDINADIQSTNMALSLSAIRYMSYCQLDQAKPILIHLLNSPYWQVRTIALFELISFKPLFEIQAIIHCLNDSSWWVKQSAMQVLKSLGAPGIKALKLLHLRVDRPLYGISESVLNNTL